MAQPPATPASIRRWVLGVLATLGVVLAVEALSRTLLASSPPLLSVVYALVLGVVVFVAMSWGLGPGLASATLCAAYAFPHYDRLDELFPNRQDRLLLATFVALVPLGLAAFAGLTKLHGERRGRAALEAEQRHSAELEAKNRELARANAALAEANEALEAFSYVVSHDLKEPVRALNAFSRALEEDHGATLPPDARDLAHRNVETSRRLARMLEGLLDYSRASRLGPADCRPLRVEEVMASADCVTRFEHLLDERHARLTVLPGPAVLASPPALAQALGNLVLNALKHNPNAKPAVRVRSATWPQDPDYVEVVVEDNGPGFPPAVIQRFDALKQARPSTVRGGFGLLIAKRSTERMGGKMWLSASEELGGAAVHVLLPAAGTGEVGPVEMALKPTAQGQA